MLEDEDCRDAETASDEFDQIVALSEDQGDDESRSGSDSHDEGESGEGSDRRGSFDGGSTTRRDDRGESCKRCTPEIQVGLARR